ncbi:Ribonucleases P/MRP protein subunit [Wickerhamomyces ciferrii]|uniref:Ribonucleases P/MRP protein subunit n=1 Tax=Wickerhamomyces ciferrii (strain ATCC 14091 / BCRC 22168 / CBS 111 / JCM 3599 / NBRC 0793 / NRRL Y-1031 F-60-10) TaxID=1206466 RepID=K0KIA5_WICCF|nr:Ribonucleases P/MRP protein subunit [Wickerhamomyces ciferrii]CCH42731.1 Ribonucleases P/MRP protein subunit [Wickerhamomyces ciferrii]
MNSIKAVEKKKKQVFKPLLDNPFTQAQFPRIEPSIQSQILDFLIHILEDIGKYESLKSTSSKSNNKFTLEKPEILDHITLGFNSTVQKLESQAQGKPQKQIISYVLVCKADIQPSLITSQFPVLSYTASSEHNKVKLVQLPKGSIEKIEKVLGKKNGIIGLSKTEFLPNAFIKLLDDVPNVEVPWLENIRFVKPNIKLLETTATIAPKKDKNKNNKVGKK